MPDLLSSATGAWIGLAAAIAVLLAVDLVLVRGRGGTMTLRQAAIASVAWVGVSLAFFAVLLVADGPGRATEYLAGYVVEKSLSLDNVFVFLLVFGAFAIPAAEQHRLLTYGIVGALVLRLGFILVGATVLGMFSWLNLVFAALLLWTGWRLFRDRHDHGAEARLVERVVRRLPISERLDRGALAGRVDGRRVLGIAGAALAAIAVVDVIFAIDSVPAILAITTDTYVVFAANAFALLGLRPLFFLVGGLVERLYYLKASLAVLLGFIGVKMAWGQLVGKVGPEVSLPVIVLILAAGVVASLLRERRRGPAAPDQEAERPKVAA